MLKDFEAAPLAVFVVWEPILVTDSVGVRTGALARIPDRRATQFWDKSHRLSAQMGGPQTFGQKSGAKILFDMDEYVWDFVAVYSPGFRWKDSSRSPAFAGAPVLKVIADLRAHLAGAVAALHDHHVNLARSVNSTHQN
ncbi:MAG TPA: hypothetical protein VL285_23310, partial [Bryobacteraceae bacterium]|nr:hypothetical protein [Bryobacteraceae bacterium]